MHLLNTSSVKLKNFPTTIPPYAILSHTWDEDEVSFDDINEPHAATMKGYEKIKISCTQAALDGYEWIWIDTCCIDKRSSAELSEAINSMYMWYWDSEICYAYLSDVPGPKFVEARWFTRGWTLQELLAPTIVEFYTRDPVWRRIGTKLSLACEIERATGIQKTYLLDRRAIQQACVGEKFSWASKRITTRPDDVAYCLLGLVGVNMPLLYGEGAKAFHRLQLEIIKENIDHTIFAWEHPSINVDRARRSTMPKTPLPMFLSQLWGMLAPTPLWFSVQHDDKLHRIDSLPRDIPFEMTNLGLRITLPSVKLDDRGVLALLSCRTSKKARVGIHLTHIRDDIYARVPRSPIYFNSNFSGMQNAKELSMFTPALTISHVSRPRKRPWVLQVHELRIWDMERDSIGTPGVSSHLGKIEDSECAAVLLPISGISLVLIFGYNHPFTYLKLLEENEVRLSTTLDSCANDMQISCEPDESNFSRSDPRTRCLRDHLHEEIQGLGVRVSARRTLWEEHICWRLTIHIWKASTGPPDGGTANRLYTDFDI